MSQTKLRIRTYGDPDLKKKTSPVAEVNEEIRGTLDAMVELMRAQRGVGLAANQVGLDKRLIIIEFENNLFKLINPEIIQKSGILEFEEGCLSFPGLYIKVHRAEKIWVDFLDEHGRRRTIQAQGILSVVIQHEVDHLNGILFIERIPLYARLKYFKRLEKIKKEGSLHGGM